MDNSITDQFRFGVRQGDTGRDQRRIIAQNERFQRYVAQQTEVQRFLRVFQRVGIVVEIHGEAGLRVGVNRQDPLSPLGEGVGQVNRRGRLADPAFLVRYRDHGIHEKWSLG